MKIPATAWKLICAAIFVVAGPAAAQENDWETWWAKSTSERFNALSNGHSYVRSGDAAGKGQMYMEQYAKEKGMSKSEFSYAEYERFSKWFLRYHLHPQPGVAPPGPPGPPPISDLDLDSLDVRPIVYTGTHLPPHLPEWFAKLDTDKDGQIGLYEWLAAKKPLAQFKTMDRNQDGFLTPDEVLYHLYGDTDPVVIAAQLQGKAPDTPAEKPGKGKFPGFDKKGGFKKGGFKDLSWPQSK